MIAARRSSLVWLCVLAACACRAAAPRPDSGADGASRAHGLGANGAVARAAASPTEPAAASEDDATAPVVPGDDEVSRLLVSLGVRIDRARGVLEVDGWVNQREGVVEVFACAPQGKTHESVVVLDCVPSGLQAGLLAIGLVPGAPAEQRADGTEVAPTGDAVEIRVRWLDADGRERSARAEDWVWLEGAGRTMAPRGWIFAGSYEQPASDGSGGVVFAADQVKTLATTYRDTSTILENPAREAFDDTLYVANARAVPPVGTKLVATFRRAEVRP